MESVRDARYDLFILHADADRAWVDGYLKHAVGGDPARLVTSRDFELAAAIPAEFDRFVTTSRYTAAVLSPAFLTDGWGQFGEHLVSYTSVEENRVRVIALQLHDCKPPLHLRFRVGLDFTDWTVWDDQAAKIRALLDRPDPPPEVIPCPYPGMVAFRPEDARLFHGREQEIDDLLRSIRQQNFLLVVGPSGSGKSSLIVAGLLARLQESTYFTSGYWRVRSFRPGADPMARLTGQLGGDPHQAAEAISALLQDEPPAQRLLLFIDQFEELFTQVKDRSGQQDFVRVLKALRDDPRCAIIVGMRVDFYPDLMNSALWPVDRSQIVDVAPLRGEALRKAIVRPAEEVGVYLEDGLVDSLIADAANEPGSLPMLQEALVLLWAKRERRLLTRAAYEAMGREGRSGLAVAMATKADATLAVMPPEEKRLARRIFVRLVEFGQGRPDTRRQLAVDELRAADDPPGMFDRVLGKLIDSRLLTPAFEHQGPRRVDIAHEMLIVGWPTSREWVQARRQAELTRRALETKAREWVRLGKGSGGLLDAAELPEARLWLASPDAEDLGYSAEFREHVKASADHLERDQRSARRRVRVTIGGLLAGLVIMTWLTYWGWVKTAQAREGERKARNAENQANQAERQARATSIQIAMQRGDWRRALDLIGIALTQKEGNPVALRLNKIRALGALQEVPRVTEEIEAISTLTDLQGYDGNVLLWQADLEWNRSRSLEKTTNLIRLALEKGFRVESEGERKLPEAEREYAEGLLAETVDLAVEHFRRAIELVPSHQRANGMLGTLLILTGRISEARVQIGVAETLFPDDPSFKILGVWAAASENQLQKGLVKLDQLARPPADGTRPLLSPQHIKCAREIAELLDQYRKLELTPDVSWPLIRALTKTFQVLNQEQGLFQFQGRGPGTLFFPTPPVLMRTEDEYRQLPLTMIMKDFKKASLLISRITDVNPDGFFYFLEGIASSLDTQIPETERYARADKAFLKAAEARSFLPVRSSAEYCAMAMEWMKADGPVENPITFKQAAERMRSLVDSGSVRPYMVQLLTHIAVLAADWDRARWLVTRWPDTPGLEKHRSRIYYETHSYDLAIGAAKKILEQNPTDANALKMRSFVIQKLEKQLEGLKAEKPSVPKSP